MTTLFDLVPKRLEGTSMQSPLEALLRTYQKIDVVQHAWIAASPYRCPPGCGICCENFEPDILDIEAYFLAAWLIRNQGDRLETLLSLARSNTPGASAETDGAEPKKGCILAEPQGNFHCTCYDGRPLICRLFGFSGDRAKDGTVRFRPCKRMDGGKRGSFEEGLSPGAGESPIVGESLGEAALLSLFGTLPPAMGDLSGEAVLLYPGSSGERKPLREALPQAISKIRYLSDLVAFDSFAEGSGGKNGG